MHLRLAPQGLLVGAMIGAAIANLVQFPAVDRAIGGIYSAISVYEHGGMAAIAPVHSRGVPERFGLSLYIGDLAPGAILDRGGVQGLRAYELYGLGRAEAVVDGGASPLPRELDQIQREATIMVTGTDRGVGPFTIALGAQPQELRFLLVSGHVWVVDTDLLRVGAAEADR